MDKPAAIGRPLRRAKSAAAAPADKGKKDTGRQAGFDLEAGIAEIFATIRSGASRELSPEDLREDTGLTHALLSRLNQLWQTPSRSQTRG